MPKNEEIPPWLVVLGVLAGGAALAALLAGNRSQPRLYACYNCGTRVVEGTRVCPNCGVTFDWSRPHVA